MQGHAAGGSVLAVGWVPHSLSDAQSLKAGTSGTSQTSISTWWSQESQTSYWMQVCNPTVFCFPSKCINLKIQRRKGEVW